MQTQIFSNPLTATIAVGSGDWLASPFYDEDGITLYHADCREILPHLKIQNAFCFTDPPYNVGKNYGTWNDAMPDADYGPLPTLPHGVDFWHVGFHRAERRTRCKIRAGNSF